MVELLKFIRPFPLFFYAGFKDCDKNLLSRKQNLTELTSISILFRYYISMSSFLFILSSFITKSSHCIHKFRLGHSSIMYRSIVYSKVNLWYSLAKCSWCTSSWKASCHSATSTLNVGIHHIVIIMPPPLL